MSSNLSGWEGDGGVNNHNEGDGLPPNDPSSLTPPNKRPEEQANAGGGVQCSDLLGRSWSQIISELEQNDEALKRASHSLSRSIKAYSSLREKMESSPLTIEISMPASRSMKLNIQLEV